MAPGSTREARRTQVPDHPPELVLTQGGEEAEARALERARRAESEVPQAP